MTKTTKNAVGLAQEGHQVTRGHNDNSLDREACKQYALANGFKWQEGKKNWNPSSADSVRGCYLFASNDNVYYNHHETSGQPCSTTMVCIQDEKPDECPSSVEFRDRYLQIGKWRFGDADGRHFTVVHDGGKTVQVYTKDEEARCRFKRHGAPSRRRGAGRDQVSATVSCRSATFGFATWTVRTPPFARWTGRPLRFSERTVPCTPGHATTFAAINGRWTPRTRTPP